MSAEPKQATENKSIESVPSNKIAYDIKNLEKRLESLIEFEKQKNRVSFGMIVLSTVAQGHYDRAFKELEVAGRGLEEYPAFEVRARRFIEHAKGLVSAIRTKHQVGRSAHVNRSKQKELSDRIAEHFVDLKKTLIIIEKIQKSVRASDLSSTTMFFKTAFYSAVVVFLVYTAYQNSSYSVEFSLRDLLEFIQLEWPME
jgi:hypothetical protein